MKSSGKHLLSLFFCVITVMTMHAVHEDGQAYTKETKRIAVIDFKKEILVTNNIDRREGVTGASVALSSASYVMRIEFQFSGRRDKQDTERRVEIFSAIPKTPYDNSKTCARKLCWTRLEAETRNFDPTQNPQEVKISNFLGKKILVTAWHPTFTPTTNGRPDSYKGSEQIIEDKKKGVRMTFEAEDPARGTTIVTILPS